MAVVVGLDTFIDYFRGHEDHYVLIGGAACSIWLEEQGLSFRSTRDLDIVIVVEGITDEFYERFWRFIEEGKYKSLEESRGRPKFYRFQRPETDGFPYMIELLTRNILALPEAAHLTPIPIKEDIASLSAILMDDIYYKFVLERRMSIQGATIIPGECLIPLKAKAWLDLTARRDAGNQTIKSADIKKHRNDVFRLLVAMSPAARVPLPSPIREDLAVFILNLPTEAKSWAPIEKAVQTTSGVSLPSRLDSINLISQIYSLELEDDTTTESEI